MVPVLDQQKQPLMPCTVRRAWVLIKKGAAKPFYQKGFFCIKLLRDPSSRECQPLALGIDPGSKREGYTALTKKAVVLNITTDTPWWVKENIESRRNLRRNRRQRKTPYRACRPNRATLRKTDRIAPSTKARWGAKLRIIKQLLCLLPITVVGVEDIKAGTKEGAKEQHRWNASFSPLEVGKKWFYAEVEKMGVRLTKVSGLETSKHRKSRDFEKSKEKMEFVWEAHNSDSHSIAEIALDSNVAPNKSLYELHFLRHYRRVLHAEKPAKGGVRGLYGRSISLGLPRGAVLRHKKHGICYLGGTSDGRISLHEIGTKKRLTKTAKLEDIVVLHNSRQTMRYVAA